MENDSFYFRRFAKIPKKKKQQSELAIEES